MHPSQKHHPQRHLVQVRKLAVHHHLERLPLTLLLLLDPVLGLLETPETHVLVQMQPHLDRGRILLRLSRAEQRDRDQDQEQGRKPARRQTNPASKQDHPPIQQRAWEAVAKLIRERERVDSK